VVNLKIVAIVVDNGEPFLEKSVESLRNQTTPVSILIAPGPDTDMELAKSLGDLVLKPTSGPGRARVQGILQADSDSIILSCDSDSWYYPWYAEEAEKWLKVFPAVKSGWVEPLEPSTLGWLEAGLCNILPYEFGLAFHRQTFLARGMHLQEYTGRLDIGHHFDGLAWPNPQMRVKTRLPTRAFQECLAYAPSLLLGSTPLAFAGGLIVWNLLK
jgi:glycosyltransferase involved in cell wall biosynthesis